VKDLLRPGNELVAAGYAMYGAATTLMFTTGTGVNGFTLDPALGEFVLTQRDLRIPRKSKIYSINEGNAASWDKPTTEYITKCKTSKPPRSARYIGSMVADIHRTLLYGGVFSYPADAKNKNGKLRLVYECNPISFLIEQAGGKATTGTQRILEVQPTALHQRVPLWCGSYDDIAEVEALYRKHAEAPKAKL